MKLMIDIPGAYYHYTKKYHDLSHIETKVLIEALIKGTPIEEDENCISRSDAIKFFKDGVYVINELNNLAPVKPAKKVGHWFVDERPKSDREIICSNCEQPIFKYHKMDFDYRPNFCPNCGATMREVE